MTTLKCEVTHITYRNEDSGWAVTKINTKGINIPVTMVGPLADVSIGSSLEVTGEWKMDSRFGRQFLVHSWREVMPTTTEGLVKYLSGGIIYGVGPHYARLIVDRFGMDTLEILDHDIDRLLEIPNIGKKKLSRIRDSWDKQKGIRSVSMFLQQHGVSAAYASKIYKVYGADTISKVKEDPYRLADDVWGIGFKYADAVATSLGYAKDDARRIRSGVIYALTRAAESDGHVFLHHDQLEKIAAAMLEVDSGLVNIVMKELTQNREVVLDGVAAYLPFYYHAEKGVAQILRERLKDSGQLKETKVDRLLKEIIASHRNVGIVYDPGQVEAIKMALTHNVMILTGGPGTGKTTTTKAIIDSFAETGKKILLAAPTGRAAKRMTEATQREAVTIHRLLEYNPMGGYGRDEDNQLEGDVLIVDECSMIDLMLFYKLLKAMPAQMVLVMVGDIDQLPSVGAGNVLHDLICAGNIPVAKLTTIFRQAQTSKIVMNAHSINAGELPDLSNGKSSDFFFIRTATASDIPETIVNLVGQRLPRAYHVNPKEIQVLTPMHKGEAGAVNLNLLLQHNLNPVKENISRGEMEFRPGDKVMQIRNNYEKNVFNGDIGYVTMVDLEARTLTVGFDGNNVEYESSELDELTLAYAVTIHKSQGCEFPVVVIPATMQHLIMLQRNLIYTAITRAKQICVLVGDSRAVATAVANFTSSSRNSNLIRRLQE